MVPYGVSGKLTAIQDGSYTLDETAYVVETENGPKEMTMLQRWPVRRGRPFKQK